MTNKERLNQFIKKIELISSSSKENLDVDEESKKRNDTNFGNRKRFASRYR